MKETRDWQTRVTAGEVEMESWADLIQLKTHVLESVTNIWNRKGKIGDRLRSYMRRQKSDKSKAGEFKAQNQCNEIR